jgi:hypothetical protein
MHVRFPSMAAAAMSLISLAGCYNATESDPLDENYKYTVDFDRAYTNHGDHDVLTYTTPAVVKKEVVVARETQPGHYDVVTHADGTRERVWIPESAGHWETITHSDGTSERAWVPDPAGHWDTITHDDGTTERVWVPAR